MLLTAILSPAEEGGYIALNPETGTTTQGETDDEAIANLKEATSLYLEEFPMTFNSSTSVQLPDALILISIWGLGDQKNHSEEWS